MKCNAMKLNLISYVYDIVYYYFSSQCKSLLVTVNTNCELFLLLLLLYKIK